MILITRPKEQSKNLETILGLKGYKTYLESLYRIKYLKTKISYNKNNYYIFPSIHSVQSLISSKQIKKFQEANILAIGNKVKQALISAGCKKIILTSKDSNDLIIFIKKLKIKNTKFLYLGSTIVNNIFFQKMNKYELDIERKIIYRTVPRVKLTKTLIKKIKLNEIRAILFYSQLATETFLKLLTIHKIKKAKAKVKFFCISSRVAKPLRVNKLKFIYIADKPNEKSMIKLIKEELKII